MQRVLQHAETLGVFRGDNPTLRTFGIRVDPRSNKVGSCANNMALCRRGRVNVYAKSTTHSRLGEPERGRAGLGLGKLPILGSGILSRV
jgi:hypothetical protein